MDVQKANAAQKVLEQKRDFSSVKTNMQNYSIQGVLLMAGQYIEETKLTPLVDKFRADILALMEEKGKELGV